MNKLVLSFLTIMLMVISLVSCSTPATAVPTPTETAENIEATLTVKSADSSVTLTWEDILELPSYEGPGGRISSVGYVTPPTTFKGITIEDLCNLVGGLSEENSVQITAKDGYGMTFSYDQIVSGNYDTYDPSDGENKPFNGKLWTVVVYEEEGNPISTEKDGPLRLAILGSNKIVTDGHWWIKWVSSIEVKQSEEKWTLNLEGEMSEKIDNASFDTCAASSCHGSSWTDEEGQTWQGVPLWILAGRVDDDNKHEGVAFNNTVAEAGYDITLIAKDGYSVTLESWQVARNDEIFLTYLLNDELLPEKYWPLRLVGPDLEKPNWIGTVETIEVNVP